MSKPKGSKSQYISKGERKNRTKGINLKGFATEADRWNNLKDAWAQGRNPWLTIENPNKEQTNKRMVRVQANQHWGNPRKVQGYVMK